MSDRRLGEIREWHQAIPSGSTPKRLAGELLEELDLLRAAYHHACAEVARWRAWYGFADFGLTEAPDEQIQDVQEEFLVQARGVGA